MHIYTSTCLLNLVLLSIVNAKVSNKTAVDVPKRRSGNPNIDTILYDTNIDANIDTNNTIDYDEAQFYYKRRRTTYSDNVRTLRSLRTLETAYDLQPSIPPHVINKVCLLEPDMGPCRANITMWYYSPEDKACMTFYWGGCQGNGNRFDRLSECKGTCLSGTDYKLPKPRFCNLNFDYGWCFGAVDRWYYDRQWKVCKKTIYSGCGGNKNNFYNQAMCENVCRFAAFNLEMIVKTTTAPPLTKRTRRTHGQKKGPTDIWTKRTSEMGVNDGVETTPPGNGNKPAPTAGIAPYGRIG